MPPRTRCSIARAAVSGSRLLLLTIAALACVTRGARADTPLPATLKEDFASAARVSGGILVGLVVGPMSGRANPRDVRIPLSPFAKPTAVCVTAKTRDGQYWAQAIFTAPPHTAGFGFMQPQPDWQFIDQLRAYRRSDFAVLARYGVDCDIDPAAPYLPISYGGAPLRLTASINVQRAISWNTRLVFAANASVRGDCEESPLGVRATAFNLVCAFDLTTVPPGTMTAELVLDRHERTGDRSDSFTVRLPW